MGHQYENTKPMETQGSSSTSLSFDSRVIFLFGGIGAMLVLIIVALLMLVCSQYKYRQDNPADRNDVTRSDRDHKAVSHVCKDEANVSPKIVVINPGEEIPTHLAAPL
ncbi:hypothetical protein CTI12_AA003920 [Artemisia annua]|uniref:Uncharacterized protein n=1 Tax=Artemisia annua TaxID=35608 RepID=A0A2U1QP21_ARTAN|nr:hypothetical protein CTI12_AA003920 [Artemisia annua]